MQKDESLKLPTLDVIRCGAIVAAVFATTTLFLGWLSGLETTTLVSDPGFYLVDGLKSWLISWAGGFSAIIGMNAFYGVVKSNGAKVVTSTEAAVEEIRYEGRKTMTSVMSKCNIVALGRAFR